MIDSKDISVVVQGAIHKKETKKCLESIRTYLPGAEIILSTWEGSDVSGLDHDVLVLSKDPGGFVTSAEGSPLNNMLRQLVSTKEGLKHANRKYVMKLRSDLILTSDKFLEYFDQYPARIGEYKLFKHKILIPLLASRFCLNKFATPFHPSDWWFLGLNEDIRTYFDIELPQEPDFSSYFANEKNLNKKTPFSVNFRFSPEQYFCYTCFSKHFPDIRMKDCSDITEKTIHQSRMVMINNFTVIDFKHSGIFTNKYLQSKNELFSGYEYLGFYNKDRYEFEYKEYCDPDFVLSKNNIYINKIRMAFRTRLVKVYRRTFKFIQRDLAFIKRLENLFIGIPIAVLFMIPSLLAVGFSKIKRIKEWA